LAFKCLAPNTPPKNEARPTPAATTSPSISSGPPSSASVFAASSLPFSIADLMLFLPTYLLSSFSAFS